MGARAAFASAATAFLLSRATGLHLPLTAVIIGAAVAMLSTALVNDDAARARRVTTALMPVPAAAALVAGTLAAPHRALSVALFVAVIFVAVYVRRYGPRGMALGMIAFNAFFFALFFQAHAAELPGMIGAIAAGGAIAYAVRFAVIPDRPARQVRRAVAAFRAAVAHLLGRVGEAVPSWRGRRLARVGRALVGSNEAALLLDDLLQGADPADLPAPKGELRERVFRMELAVGRALAAARALSLAEATPGPVRGALGRAFAHARRAFEGVPGEDERMREALAGARGALAGEDTFPAEVQLERLGAALDDLLCVASGERAPSDPEPPSGAADGPDGAADPPDPPAPVGSGPGLHPMTRQAFQAAVACALAMAAGHWIAPSRWLWAVLAAFIVLTRATTVAEIVTRAWHRTFGTVLGVVVGMVLAAAVHGRRFEPAVLFACIFFAFHALRASYARMVAWITAAIAILYSLLGRYSPEVLYVRIAQTLAGAAIGAVVATVLLPMPAGGRVRAVLAALFAEIAAYLEGALSPGGAAGGPPRRSAARALDRRLREARSAVEPLSRSRMPVGRGVVRLVQGASVLVFYLRQLPRAELLVGPGASPPEALREAASVLAANARALSAALSGDRRAALVPATRPLEEAYCACKRLGPSGRRALGLVLYWLHRIDDTMLEMANTLHLRVHSEAK